jgi:transformation/transcription domain-associated protein
MLGFEETQKKLLESNATQRLQLATDLRERIEIVHTSEFSNFLKHLFPAFSALLKRVPPQFTDTVDNKFRFVNVRLI